MSPKDPQSLEAFIHQTLRQTQPPAAPKSLEKAVLAALCRQAALPWWRQAYAYWPRRAKVAFVVSSASLVGVMLTLGVEQLRLGVAFEVEGWWSQVSESAVSLAEIVWHLVVRDSSVLWYLGLGFAGLALIASLLMVGCGACAYRFLWRTS